MKPTIRQLSLLFIAAASQTGCTDTIEVFPDGSTDGDSDAGSEQEPDQAPEDPVVVIPPDGGYPSEPHDAGVCTLRPGGTQLSPCRREYQSCTNSGPIFAEATFIGCSDARGIGGNPLNTVASCEQALLGQSGETCTTALHCTGPADDTCCVRQANCEANGSLVLAEVCVASCERTPLLSGPTVRDCADVAAADVPPESRYGSASKLPNLVGLPCVGEFVCGPETSYGFSVFCGAGRLQLLTLGPRGFASP